jgi:sortase A
VDDLKQGPGHYPGTPLPGQSGNAAIAGHRTTYGAPFHDLDRLDPGDPIFVTTAMGRFRYDVTDQLVVDPVKGGWVLDPSADDRLTLTTCNPKYSAAERLIVTAALMSVPAPVPAPATPAAVPLLATGASEAGLSGDRGGSMRAILWGAVVAGIGALGWMGGRTWRWPAYAIAAGPFLAALFMFYDSLGRALPANF